MATIMWLSVMVLVIMGIAGIASLIWRANMALNHPEKYRQFREFEKEFADDMQKRHDAATEKVGKVAKPALAVGAKVGGALLKRLLK